MASKNNVVCAYCNKELYNSKLLPEGVVGYSMCKKCRLEIIEVMKSLSETWKFQPNTGGLQLHQKAKNVMTHLPSEDEDDIEKYHHTSDLGTEKTEKLKKKYDDDNSSLSGLIKSFSTNLGS